MAGMSTGAVARSVATPPTILVFDSGLGGLTVLEQVRRARPDASYVYAADDAAFPYGRLSEPVLVERVLAVMERLIGLHAPDLVVVACNNRLHPGPAGPAPALRHAFRRRRAADQAGGGGPRARG